MGKGVQGVILKAMRATDFVFTVTSTEAVTDGFYRLGFTGGGITAAHPVHPTQWVRLWIPTDGDVQQRGYTLVDIDSEADTFAIEFAMHEGPAADWARTAKAGDTIEATVLGSNFTLPDPMPSRFVMFGDTASLPAINSLLDAIGETPSTVWLEWQHESDKQIPVRARESTDVQWVQRVDDGRLLREAAESAELPENAYAWVACDGATTRSIVKTLRAKGLPKHSIKAQAYWR